MYHEWYTGYVWMLHLSKLRVRKDIPFIVIIGVKCLLLRLRVSFQFIKGTQYDDPKFGFVRPMSHTRIRKVRYRNFSSRRYYNSLLKVSYVTVQVGRVRNFHLNFVRSLRSRVPSKKSWSSGNTLEESRFTLSTFNDDTPRQFIRQSFPQSNTRLTHLP